MASEAGLPWDAPAPTEHGKQWIKIELDHPVNPWEHEGAGSITWGAHLDRLAPLGEEAVSIVKEAWAQRREDPRERTRREHEEAQPVGRQPDHRHVNQAGLGGASRAQPVLDPPDAIPAHQRAMGRGDRRELVAWRAHQ